MPARDHTNFSVLGIDPDDEQVYTALVDSPRATAADVARACGIETAGAGRRLARLIKDGLATRVSGRPPRYTALAPDVAVTGLILEREALLNRARAQAQQLARRHYEAIQISQPELGVELLTDREDISAAVQRLTVDARREVRAFDRPPYVDRPGSNLHSQIRRQRQGVTHRVVYDHEAVGQPGRYTHDIVPSIQAGEQARVSSDVPMKLIISDDLAAIIPFSLAPGGQAAAYYIRSSPILTALGLLFESVWQEAAPLTTASGGATPNDSHPDSDTRALLALLASGLADAAVARTMGWSERTTQRRIQRLMAALGATTRFQAAALAAKRDWL